VEAEAHFIQRCEGPVFVGSGHDSLACGCGRILIAGYSPDRFLAVGIVCGGCGAVTVTPGLPAESGPPFAAVIAEPVAEPRMATTLLPAHTVIIGRADMDRITALYMPQTPADNVYRITDTLLDEAEAVFGLPSIGAASADPFGGVTEHPLAWAVRHYRARLSKQGWSCYDEPASGAAASIIGGFLHFVRTWSHHPLFAAMAATAAESGFSPHGLAPFAAAHMLTMQGNRVAFPRSDRPEGRISHFYVASGASGRVLVHTEIFNRFEHPYGKRWDPDILCAAVTDVVEATQGRINLRNPGLLLLSPGSALSGFDEALIVAVRQALPIAGKKNRGLMAAGLIVLRMQPLPDDPHAFRLCYGLFPIANRYYQGDSTLQMRG
jgi:hypothetical protein